jgi:hypothetical protein
MRQDPPPNVKGPRPDVTRAASAPTTTHARDLADRVGDDRTADEMRSLGRTPGTSRAPAFVRFKKKGRKRRD